MENFTFYAPTMFVFGDGEEQKTGELVRRFDGTKVLLVYGGGSVKKNGAYDAVTGGIYQDSGRGLPGKSCRACRRTPGAGLFTRG